MIWLWSSWYTGDKWIEISKNNRVNLGICDISDETGENYTIKNYTIFIVL